MKFLIVAFAVICGTVPAFASPKPPPPDHGISGRGSNQRVTINGSGSGSTVTSGGKRAPTPVGAVTSIGCTTDIGGDLSALGDPYAAADGATCNQRAADCRKTQPDTTNAALRLQKQANGTWTYAGADCTKPTAPVVTAAMVRDRVVRLIPTARLGLAPHDSTLVNIQTIMWVDAPKTQQLPPLTILGQRVTVSLTLSRVQWSFGDQLTDSTNGPGKAYDKVRDPCRTQQCPHYFGHTYRTSGAQTIHATATWTASFAVSGGRATDIPGTVDGPQATSTVTVKQARSVLIPNPGQH